MRRILMGVIRLYQTGISPLTPPSCRFTPTCSAYALDAVEQHGSLRGSWLAFRRILRCHPWGGSGHDPVPSAKGAEMDAGSSPGKRPSLGPINAAEPLEPSSTSTPR